jgi:hypothetical protein
MTDTNTHRRKMFRLIEECEASGKTRKQFCEDKNLSANRFYYWQKRYREQNDTEAKSFVPIKTRPLEAQVTNNIEIHYPNGVWLHLPAGTGIEMIRSMVGLI